MKDETVLPLIIGHRGSSAHAPENKLAAFRRAIIDGADGIEFDVRLARDGVPVVFHDPSLIRTARMNAAVRDLTSAELSKVNIGSWFDEATRGSKSSQFSSETISTLAEVLAHLSEFHGVIFIELKCDDDRDVEPLASGVCSVLRNSPLAPQVIVKSFKLAAIPHVRILGPGIRTAALFAPKIMNILRKEKHLVKIAEEFGADELSLHYSLATKKLMVNAARRGLPVSIWTADSPRWVKRAMALGLKSIITNDPARLILRRSQLLSS